MFGIFQVLSPLYGFAVHVYQTLQLMRTSQQDVMAKFSIVLHFLLPYLLPPKGVKRLEFCTIFTWRVHVLHQSSIF